MSKIYGLSTVDISEADIEAVTNCLRSGRISPGNIQKELETKVAEIHGYSHSTFVCSGQSALHLALEAYKLLNPKLKYIVCPAVTYISTLSAVWNAGLEVKLTDVNKDLLMELPADTRLDDSIGVCPVNLMGMVPFWQNLGDWTLEDSCESFDVRSGQCRSWATSFYASHQITSGSGGLLATDDQQVDLKVKSLCNHGRVDSPDLLYTANRNHSFDKSKNFVFDKVGYSNKCSDFTAALVLSQFERRKDIIGKHIRNAQILNEGLADLPMRLPQMHFRNCNYMNYIMIVDNAKDFVTYLNSNNIETRSCMPIINQPIIEERMPTCYMNDAWFPNAFSALNRAIYCGCHSGLSKSDMKEMVKIIRAYFI